MKHNSYKNLDFSFFFEFFFRELMHVDDAVDELRDKEKMN